MKIQTGTQMDRPGTLTFDHTQSNERRTVSSLSNRSNSNGSVTRGDGELLRLAKAAFATQSTTFDQLLSGVPKENQATFKLQQYLQHKSMVTDTISSVLKILHDLSMALLRNLPRAG